MKLQQSSGSGSSHFTLVTNSISLSMISASNLWDIQPSTSTLQRSPCFVGVAPRCRWEAQKEACMRKIRLRTVRWSPFPFRTSSIRTDFDTADCSQCDWSLVLCFIWDHFMCGWGFARCPAVTGYPWNVIPGPWREVLVEDCWPALDCPRRCSHLVRCIFVLIMRMPKTHDVCILSMRGDYGHEVQLLTELMSWWNQEQIAFHAVISCK